MFLLAAVVVLAGVCDVPMWFRVCCCWQHEERLTNELSAFLEEVELPSRTSHSLSRSRLLATEGSIVTCKLPFPLSEDAVVAMVRALERGESLDGRSLGGLLDLQVLGIVLLCLSGGYCYQLCRSGEM